MKTRLALVVMALASLAIIAPAQGTKKPAAVKKTVVAKKAVVKKVAATKPVMKKVVAKKTVTKPSAMAKKKK